MYNHYNESCCDHDVCSYPTVGWFCLKKYGLGYFVKHWNSMPISVCPFKCKHLKFSKIDIRYLLLWLVTYRFLKCVLSQLYVFIFNCFGNLFIMFSLYSSSFLQKICQQKYGNWKCTLPEWRTMANENCKMNHHILLLLVYCPVVFLMRLRGLTQQNTGWIWCDITPFKQVLCYRFIFSDQQAFC